MSSTVSVARLRQRADYTHKHNTKTGRHGWLRLTPAYSVKIVDEIIGRHGEAGCILDPFCGTATTALSAAYHGHEAVTTDINPFLVWLGQAKLATYFPDTIAAAHDAGMRVLSLVRAQRIVPSPHPPIHNIARWWGSDALDFLCATKAAIAALTQADSQVQTLLHVAFCRTLIAVSNAAFDHQSMSFKDDGQRSFALDRDMAAIFTTDLRFVLDGAADNPDGSGRAVLGDARNLVAMLDRRFDLIVTSPPYANRMSYIRELRPYMYWLDYLTNGRDAGNLDWSAIGGTWGIATSRLLDWQRRGDGFSNARLDAALHRIAHHSNKSGHILSLYIAKYFDDIWKHFQCLSSILSFSATIHYIVGNSKFYGVTIDVEMIYADMLHALGFREIECRPIRKRNSKKELVEFDVTARWLAIKRQT